MKKTFFVLCLMMTMFASCTDGNADVKKCWEFTLTQVAEVSMDGEILSTQNTESTVNQCAMTATEAAKAAKGMAGTSSSTTNGMTIKLTITVTYKEVAES